MGRVPKALLGYFSSHQKFRGEKFDPCLSSEKYNGTPTLEAEKRGRAPYVRSNGVTEKER